MSQESETALRKSFDAIDRIRRRVLMGGWLAVVVTLGAYAHLYYVSRTSHDVEKLVGASVTALTCLIAWAEFAVILIVIRMTTRILRAIDLALK
ncbi:MAG: hypothetical protein NEA02_09710 [Thermoanaerobaculia bacterium]|nr:hypothetical protein [Thermoanaerobaculia bacterium]